MVHLKGEIELLSLVKNFIDELNIVDKLFQDQKEALNSMNDILKSVDDSKRDGKLSGGGAESSLQVRSDQEGKKTQLPREDPSGTKDQPDNHDRTQAPDNTTKEADRTTNNKLKSTNQGPRLNPNQYRQPVGIVAARIGKIDGVIERVKGMIQRAEKVEKAVRTVFILIVCITPMRSDWLLTFTAKRPLGPET